MGSRITVVADVVAADRQRKRGERNYTPGLRAGITFGMMPLNLKFSANAIN